ncbi:FGGY-family carbohydrate kinase [Herbiconiux sp. P17]|uniref:xylulokinase n=1 Tax=Herbiconiux wuyangfengii TaxID=3342794 RepID=UPI0035B78C48
MTTVLAYDFGTTSLKAAVVEHGGRLLADANAGYPIVQPHPGWAEQNPALLWQKAGEVGRTALERAGRTGHDIDSVVFVAPWKGVVPVSEAGEVLADAIIWMDGRAAEQAAALNERAGFFVGTGQEYWPRLMWLKQHRPAVWAKARWILGLNSYLKWRATGVVVTEPSDDFISAPPVDDGGRHAAILAAAGLSGDLHRFPPQRAATEVAGALTAGAAADLGLRAGIPVFGGFGDIPAITVGTGPVASGAAHIYFGTSSWLLSVLAPGRRLDAPLTVRIDAEHDAAVFPLQTGCLAYDWIVEQLYGAEKAHLNDEIQDFVNAQVAEVPPGSGNLLATHWLNGELPPLSKNAKGTFINLTTQHDRRHMVRAVMESLCYTHRGSLERLEQQTGEHLAEITVVGGGATSEVWMQMLADVIDRVVVVPANPRATGVIGAHWCSVVGLGEAAGFASVLRSEPSARRFAPQPANRAAYDRMFALHDRIFPALKDLFDDLNGPAS